MGTRVKDPRNRSIGLRLTEKEETQLRRQMDKANYLSVSRYMRDRLLGRRSHKDVLDSRSGKPEETIIFKRKDMLQKIEIIGSIVSDAELKEGRDGSKFIVFRVGVYENFGEERRSTFYDVTYPNSKILAYLKKNRIVYVSGRLSLRVNTRDGEAYLNARISAKDIELCAQRED